MKTLFFRSMAAIVPLIAISILGQAQSVLPYVVASAGGSGAMPGGVTLDFTLGEPFVATIGAAAGPKFTQGFLQPSTSGNPLPVTLVRFDARREGSTAQLHWATTEETNSNHFEIERGIDGKIWKMIGNVQSAGESKQLIDYYFVDNSPENGDNFYRLRMVDADGTFAYSRIRVLRYEDPKNVGVYPNPVADRLFIRDFIRAASLRIVNKQGIQVYQSDEVGRGEINVSKLSTGLHMVEIIWLDGTRTAQKIVIQK